MIRFLRNNYFEIALFLVMGVLIYGLTSGLSSIGALIEWTRDLSISNSDRMRTLTTIFMSIFIEGLPFILLGVLVSSLIHVFVNEDLIYRVIPRNPILSIPMSVGLGLFLPICECGIVPISKRLMQKGMPPSVAITFLLSAPVVNPITIFSTYVAFGNQWSIALQRVGLAALLAVIIGFLFHLFFHRKELSWILQTEHEKIAQMEVAATVQTNSTESVSHGGCCSHHTTKDASSSDTCCDHSHSHGESMGEKVNHTLFHTIFEFFNTAKYFVLGAMIASFFQVFIGVAALKEVTGNEFVSILFVITLAFLLSICSSSDAFIAASLRTVLPSSSIFAFLVYGPMMDLKNFLMMAGNFRASVVNFLFATTTLLTIVIMLLIY